MKCKSNKYRTQPASSKLRKICPQQYLEIVRMYETIRYHTLYARNEAPGLTRFRQPLEGGHKFEGGA